MNNRKQKYIGNTELPNIRNSEYPKVTKKSHGEPLASTATTENNINKYINYY